MSAPTINGNAHPLERLTPLPLTAGDTKPAADVPASKRPWYSPLLAGDVTALWPAAVIAFTLVLVIGFTMSYHGLFEFGRVIMSWPIPLCALSPIGVDL